MYCSRSIFKIRTKVARCVEWTKNKFQTLYISADLAFLSSVNERLAKHMAKYIYGSER
jgi:hypothetical protein